MSIEQANRVRVKDMRNEAAATVEKLSAEIGRMREALGRAEERLAVAERELVYWTNVREPAELLRECGFEGRFEIVTSGHDFVRDGVSLRRCNRTHPCPEHGRPLADSDWRLHPVNGRDFMQRDFMQRHCPMHPAIAVAPGALCPQCQATGEELAKENPLQLPRPTMDL